MTPEAPRDGVALFGGAFNPPHLSHERMVRAAVDLLPLERLLVLPSGRHPWKHGDRDHAPAQARLDLCRIAFADLPRVEVSEVELRGSGPSYTVDTLRLFADALPPGIRLYWLIGSDSWSMLAQWREHHEVLRLATLVTYPRAGAPCDEAVLAAQDLTAAERASLLANVLPAAPESVSSSEVRRRLAAGADVSHLVNPFVLARIRELHLYGT